MKVALIVQRYGSEVVGGSESLARQYAHSLAQSCAVDVLTSCALDHVTWRDHFAPGTSMDGPVTVRRFAVDFERGPYWFDHLDRLLTGNVPVDSFLNYPQCKLAHRERLAAWPHALQIETLRRQGPYSSALLDYLGEHRRTYDAFLFCTYLYAPTYFGMQQVPAERILLCPTLHDEPMAYLPIYEEVFRRPRFTIFLSEAERDVARRLFDCRGDGEVIGMAIPPPPDAGQLPHGTPEAYVLYAGRHEPAKGTADLIQCFLAFKQRYPSGLKLVLIGREVYPMPRHPEVASLGFVSEGEKFALMKGAQVFVHPSPFESFSIVLLESFQAGTPALVTGHSEALVEHCRNSNAGCVYDCREEFIVLLRRLTTDPQLRDQMGAAGQKYVAEQFAPAAVSRKLWGAVQAVVPHAGRFEARVEYSTFRPLRSRS